MKHQHIVLFILGSTLALVATGRAQGVLTPQAVEQLRNAVGNRIEAFTILGGDYGATGGIYTFDGGNMGDLSVTKFGGGGAVMSPMPLGASSLKWAPVLLGNIGYSSVENDFESGYLEGNRSESSLLALQAGGGARFYFTDHFSISPLLGTIYGHSENDFIAGNAVGRKVKAEAGGTLVDWDLDTWSVVPSLDLRYDWQWGRTTLEFSSRFSYFHTESFQSSSPVLGIDGDSQTWENKLDLDVPLGVRLFDRELHTGGYFAHTQIMGDASGGLDCDAIETVNGRLVLDVEGAVWPLRWIGVGCSYSWSESFTGWSTGLDLNFRF